MPLADVNGTKLFYEIHGEGYPVILLHGFGATRAIWIAQVGALSKHFKVITYDNRSSGESEHPNEPYTLETLVEDLKGLMDFLKIERAHLIGQSMGGWITQNYVLKYPERVNKIVLMGTNHKGSGIHMMENTMADLYEQQKVDKEQAYWKYAKLVHHRRFIKEMQADPNKKFYGIWSAKDMINEMTENQMAPKDYKLLADAVEEHNVTDQLHKIKNQVLLIAATHDKLSPKMVLEEMQERLPNSSIETFDNTAHHVFIEVAPEVNEKVLTFLKN